MSDCNFIRIEHNSKNDHTDTKLFVRAEKTSIYSSEFIRIEKNYCISLYKLRDNTTHSRKESISTISSLVTTAKWEFISAVVSLHELSTSLSICQI